MFMYIEFRYIPRFHNDLPDALATLASMLPYPGNTYITPLEIQVRDNHGYCHTVEAEPDDVLYKQTPDLNSLRCLDAEEAENIMNEVHAGVNTQLEQLALIEEKRLTAICFGQLYQQRMARAYKKKVHPRHFEVGQLVLKRILPHQEEAKRKFPPNWQGEYLIKDVLSKGALHLTDVEGKITGIIVNADSVKRYYI
ncbi:uncharacterized protein LOC107016540 [Solanum pennellii]|uniref:Uncharacterized protein LOC107016540 n=1 Tax=Solanum pennellii TaxID=28526 RepID=A0ABM1GKS6_SOLPN|nr:uncharacterized protein LOC107016540 [Solanum pennellii]